MNQLRMQMLFAVVPVLQMGWTMAARDGDAGRVLFNFADAAAAKQWQPVNDGVMGGRSSGQFTITDDQTMQFFGSLSLENNGGFASVRSMPIELGLSADDTIKVRVRGDGRTYLFNLYPTTRRIAFSHRAVVETTRDEWTEVMLPVKDFEATSFGRKVPNAPPVDATQVNAVGFMLSDKQSGPFKLEVEWIKVIRVGERID